ncbi:G-protein coupled receptor Mth2 [Holothuria leucospilota]|uniref:G-protein coupled receptor Mth2 n=1 Tax=Holothuria leucospilota TaxID=206669 RepID=A0A9Q1HAN8_HOLLE|nr:G-protein coupled receptor Mth2 [Holothuria leucospilota]
MALIKEPCRTCDYLHRYYGECPENSLPPTFDEQEKLKRLPPAEYLRCRTLTGESIRSYRGDHYWMISDCPNGTDTLLMTKCRAIESETYPAKIFTPPVLSKSLNVLFKNEFCAACNLVSKDDFELITVYSICEQCQGSYAIQEGEELELESNSCRILPHTTLPRECFVMSSKTDVACPVPKYITSERHLTNLFSHVTFLGPQCSRDEVFLNGLCVSLQNYCKHRPSVSLLILSVNTAKYNCSYLKGRSEECFFKKLLSYELKVKHDLQPQIDSISAEGNVSIHLDGAFSTFSTPWMKTARPSWWNNSEYPEIFFYLPKNLTSKLHWKQNIISAIASFFLDLDVSNDDASTRDCYLDSVELFEVCPPDEAVDSGLQCKGHATEIAVDTNQTTDAMIHSWYTNSKWYKGIAWYGYKTRFRLGNNNTKSLIVCLRTREDRKYETNTAYFIVTNLCCVIAVLCLILTFLVYLITSSLRNTFGTVMMIFVLSFALGLTFIQFIDPYIVHITWLCETLAILTHWLWLSVFAWMSVLAFDLRETFKIKNMRVVNKINRKKLSSYFAIGWGLPSVIVSVCVIVWTSGSVSLFYGSHKGGICWIYESAAAAVVISGPLIFCLFVNVILFTMIIKGILAHRQTSTAARLYSNQTNGSISALFITIKISVLMGFTWMFGYIAPLANIDEFNFLFYLFILLQGISIFALFGASKRVRKLWKKNLDTRFSSQSTGKSNPRTQNSDVL